MPKVTEEYTKARKQQVLEAALTCFARNGLHETTMKDISIEAGVSYGVVYHYFPSKEDVFLAAARTSHEGRTRRYEEASQGETALEALINLSRYRIERWEEDGRESELLMRVHLFAQGPLDPRVQTEMRDGYTHIADYFAAAVRRGQEAGEVAPDVDADSVGRVLVSLHEGLLVQKAVTPEIDVSAYMRAVATLLAGTMWTGKKADIKEA